MKKGSIHGIPRNEIRCVTKAHSSKFEVEDQLMQNIKSLLSTEVTTPVQLREMDIFQCFSTRNEIGCVTKAPATKSEEDLLIQNIESLVSTEVTIPVQLREMEIFQPFSIHGYVAAQRETILTECLPFGENSNSMDDIPLMDIPNFRWWCCENCIREVISDTLCDDINLGYVAAQRETNWKECLPFGENSNSKDDLQPMDVPNFRWWHWKTVFEKSSSPLLFLRTLIWPT